MQPNVGIVLQYLDIGILLRCIGCLLNQCQILLEHRRDGKTHLLAEVLEVALMLRVIKCLELFSQVSLLRYRLDLLDEDAVEQAGLLLIQALVLLLLVLE